MSESAAGGLIIAREHRFEEPFLPDAHQVLNLSAKTWGGVA